MELRFQDPTFHENELTLKFLRSGKVVAKVGNGRSHHTLHPGTATGVIDLHKTDESHPEKDPARHQRLWALPQHLLIERLTAAGPSLLRDFWILWRPLRLGWMIRRGLAIGPLIPADDFFPSITAIKTREGPREESDPLNSWMKPSEAVYKAGESFYEAPNEIHQRSANGSRSESVKFLAYFVCDHDAPLSVGAAESPTSGGKQP